MKNWVAENPAYSIILYTMIVISFTWGFSTFILEESKIDSYKARLEMYEDKTETLGMEISELEKENLKYLRWLENTPNSIPFLEYHIIELENENIELKKEILVYKNQTGSLNNESMQEYYYNSYSIRKGNAIVDQYTGLTLGVSNINVLFEAEITLTLPGEDTIHQSNVKPGDVWYFNDNKFKITITKINWYTDNLDVEISEITQKY